MGEIDGAGRGKMKAENRFAAIANGGFSGGPAGKRGGLLQPKGEFNAKAQRNAKTSQRKKEERGRKAGRSVPPNLLLP